MKNRLDLWAGIYFSCLAILVLPGCGSNGPEIVPAEGRISYNGGAWPAEGIIYCNPVESPPGVPKRPCSGFFDTDGKLTFKTFKKGDGLIPGTYKVSVECWKVPPLSASEQPSQSYVPIKYQSGMTSGFDIKIEPKQKMVQVNFDVIGPAL